MHVLNFGLFLLLFCLNYSEGKPKIQNALLFLSHYGYLAPNSMLKGSLVDAKTFKNSLKEFQSFAGIPKTGKLDKRTVKMMSSPRCGMPDKVVHAGRSKRYATLGSKWSNKRLTYKITKYSERIGRAETDRAIQNAFNLWSKYTDLTFQRSGHGQIDIRFEEGNHGDDYPFDGSGPILAHAFSPQYGGATHFDDAEPWTVGGGRGYDILQTAVHEFGHALGLDHSNKGNSVMAPYYNNRWSGDLYSDDIAGIQRLYGGKSGGSPTATPPRLYPPFFGIFRIYNNI